MSPVIERFWNFSLPTLKEEERERERERRPKKVFILIGGFARKSSPADGRTDGRTDGRRTVSKGERESETLIVCLATTFFRATLLHSGFRAAVKSWEGELSLEIELLGLVAVTVKH